MRILLLHKNDFIQMSLMESVCRHLNDVGVYMDMLNITTKEFISPQGGRFQFGVVDKFYKFLMRIPKVRVLIKKYFPYNSLLCSWIARNYDILDIQSLFVFDFSTIAKKCHQKGIRIKTHIWGSDLFRETVDQKVWHDEIYKHSDKIQVSTENAVSYFKKVYPQYADKLIRIPYGLDQFDLLDKLLEDSTSVDFSFFDKQVEGKMLVTCGYNGRKEQQHMLILEAIEKLPIELKQKIFLFLPMTYLLEEDYYHQINEKLKTLQIPYQIQRERLSLHQNLSMRIKTDIVVNIQTTDGLAASLQEHLYCGNVLLAGDWLPYDIYLDNGIYYCKTAIENLSSNLQSVIENYPVYKQWCLNNRKSLYNLTSWTAIAPQWRNMYEEIISGSVKKIK
ncbi:MAG: glycosyltransferase [Bacteroidales bacterium]|nr:glycosyltransferase [Bacteroidales bacterium]